MSRNVITILAMVVLMVCDTQGQSINLPHPSCDENAVTGDSKAAFDNSAEQSLIPDHFQVRQNYPNPFNATTTIEYSLPEEARVYAVIYNVLGYQIKTLKDELQIAGRYRLEWDGTTYNGQVAASGVYFYVLLADDNYSIGKMLLLK